jgi:hypothetical protein
LTSLQEDVHVEHCSEIVHTHRGSSNIVWPTGLPPRQTLVGLSSPPTTRWARNLQLLYGRLPILDTVPEEPESNMAKDATEDPPPARSVSDFQLRDGRLPVVDIVPEEEESNIEKESRTDDAASNNGETTTPPEYDNTMQLWLTEILRSLD